MANGNGKHLKRVRIDDLLTFSPITKNQEKTFKSFKGGQNLIQQARHLCHYIWH